MLCSKNGLKPVSYSVFYDLSEKLSQKIPSRNIFKKRGIYEKLPNYLFFTPSEFFQFFDRKKGLRKRKAHIFLTALKSSIEWCMKIKRKFFLLYFCFACILKKTVFQGAPIILHFSLRSLIGSSSETSQKMQKCFLLFFCTCL